MNEISKPDEVFTYWSLFNWDVIEQEAQERYRAECAECATLYTVHSYEYWVAWCAHANLISALGMTAGQIIDMENVGVVHRYHIASARCYEVKSASGRVMTKEDDVVWLGMEEGYRSCQTDEAQAMHFNRAAIIKNEWAKWDGMPWYFRLKPRSLAVYEVTETSPVRIKPMKRQLTDEQLACLGALEPSNTVG